MKTSRRSRARRKGSTKSHSAGATMENHPTCFEGATMENHFTCFEGKDFSRLQLDFLQSWCLPCGETKTKKDMERHCVSVHKHHEVCGTCFQPRKKKSPDVHRIKVHECILKEARGLELLDEE